MNWSNIQITFNKNIISIKNRDVDAKTINKIIVQNSPKTEASNRIIPLTQRSLNILKEMYEHKTSDIVFMC